MPFLPDGPRRKAAYPNREKKNNRDFTVFIDMPDLPDKVNRACGILFRVPRKSYHKGKKKTSGHILAPARSFQDLTVCMRLMDFFEHLLITGFTAHDHPEQPSSPQTLDSLRREAHKLLRHHRSIPCDTGAALDQALRESCGPAHIEKKLLSKKCTASMPYSSRSRAMSRATVSAGRPYQCRLYTAQWNKKHSGMGSRG